VKTLFAIKPHGEAVPLGLVAVKSIPLRDIKVVLTYQFYEIGAH
jgi:hypothetical protein